MLSVAVLSVAACKKQDDFLNAKPNQSLEVPTTLADLQNLLNDENVFNRNCDPALGEISSDDFYVQNAAFSNLGTTLVTNAYTWNKTIYTASSTLVDDWDLPYTMVYNANTVLDQLPKINNDNPAAANQIKGSALFYRAYAFYNLVQTFAMPYDSTSAASEVGIPLRLTSDLNAKSVRSSEAACYSQIISDLQMALSLLPVIPAHKTQPSQPAVNAFLSRIYLAMSNYTKALQYANSCLAQFSTLVDYNTLTNPTTTSINDGFIDEDIYHSSMVNYSMLAVRRNSVVDSNLYSTYSNNDLRKTKFFAILDGLPQFPRFVGSYDFLGNKFDGLATDEIYLNKAECQARSGNTADAMNTLNALLTTRWATGTFTPYTAVSNDQALQIILLERRKELVYRGLRWTDLRRLNKDPNHAITLSRSVNGSTYSLPPNDPRYALPIPDIEISLNGLTQNQRKVKFGTI